MLATVSPPLIVVEPPIKVLPPMPTPPLTTSAPLLIALELVALEMVVIPAILVVLSVDVCPTDKLLSVLAAVPVAVMPLVKVARPLMNPLPVIS